MKNPLLDVDRGYPLLKGITHFLGRNTSPIHLPGIFLFGLTSIFFQTAEPARGLHGLQGRGHRVERGRRLWAASVGGEAGAFQGGRVKLRFIKRSLPFWVANLHSAGNTGWIPRKRRGVAIPIPRIQVGWRIRI